VDQAPTFSINAAEGMDEDESEEEEEEDIFQAQLELATDGNTLDSQQALSLLVTNNQPPVLHYPNIELDFQVEDPESITSGEPAYLKVKIERDIEEEAPHIPGAARACDRW
jgi:hypothetical protein